MCTFGFEMMDSRWVGRLKKEQEKAIVDTDIQLKQWKAFKGDYQALKDRLKTLPDKVTHDIMVPFGKLAFMPGQLVHTNEILVLLGDNWFVERSAKQACDIIDRRVLIVDEQIQNLEAQRRLLAPRLQYTSDLQSQERNVLEITEDYDEEKEKQWRERHKLNLKKEKQREREVNALDKPLLTDEQIWARLDELQIQENKGRELARMSDERKEWPRGEALSTSPRQPGNYGDDTQMNEEGDISDSDEFTDEDTDEDADEEISDEDEEEEEDSLGNPSANSRNIIFSHKPVSSASSSSSASTEESSTSGEVTAVQINTPADVYKLVPRDVPIKPILRTRKTSLGRKERRKKTVRMKEEGAPSRNPEQKIKTTNPVALTHSVLEREPPVAEVESHILTSTDIVTSSSPTVAKHLADPDIEGSACLQGSVAKRPPQRMSKFRAERLARTDNR